MKRVLIVAPHFAPVAAPDGQRARLLLPHLAALGWHATVLAVDPAEVAAPREEALLATLPAGADIRRVQAWPLRFCRRFGLGNLGWRALTALWREGSRLLRAEKFDLVYFSTTQFAVLPLGRLWLRRFGVPYVIDLQDPWRNDYYARSGNRPPGGWKYRLAAAQAALLEEWTLRRCAHVISVSPDYLAQLAGRYPWFDHRTSGTVIPFGWSRRDLACARSTGSEIIFPDTKQLLYIGRIGADMTPFLRVLFAAFANWRRKSPAGPQICLRFIGTSYSPRAGGDSVVRRIASETDIADFVDENSARVGYLDALTASQRADANLILGSEDLGYSPSKTWPLLACARPWVAVTPRESVIAKLLLAHSAGGLLVHPDSGSEANDALGSWFERMAKGELSSRSEVDETLLEYEAERLAAEHVRIFDRCTES